MITNQKRRLLVVLVLLALFGGVLLPAFVGVRSASARQGEYVQNLYVFITLSNRQGASSDDAFRMVFYSNDDDNDNSRTELAEIFEYGGIFSGNSGKSVRIYRNWASDFIPRNAMVPQNMCLEARGSDGILIDTLFVVGYNGVQWEVYAAWVNYEQLWLDEDGGVPGNNEWLDLANGDCRR
ncbi:MAG: hypothetical protein GYB65_02085 [Chloroflexi bacterium]|nr:hypothetical protein [Chloroflexota bacterium]